MPSRGGGGGFSGYGGSRSCGKRTGGSCSLKKTCWILLYFTIITVIFLALGVGPPLGVSRNIATSKAKAATDFYSPGDSRLQSFSSFFCESVTLDVGSTVDDVSLTLTLINSPPTLSERNSFNTSDQRTIMPTYFGYWQYYLYPGSNISISVCNLAQNSQIDVYVIEGYSNANNWGRSPSPRHAELFVPVREACPPKRVITYNVSEENQHYVFLYNSLQSSSVGYSVSLEFERFEYSLPPDDGTAVSCSARSGEQCTVDIPYSTGSQQALVVATIPENVDWRKSFHVNISCNRRHWALAIVVILPSITVTAVIVGLLMCAFINCKSSKTYRKL